MTEPPNKNEVTSLTAHRKLILSDLVGGFNTWKVVPRKYLLSLKGGLETPKDYFTCRRLLVIFPNYPRILMSFREIRMYLNKCLISKDFPKLAKTRQLIRRKVLSAKMQ